MTLAPSTDLGIRRTSIGDIAAVASTVAAAFVDDPVTQWLLPDEHRRRHLVQPLFELYVAPYVRAGETYLTADGAGAAVWLAPATPLLTDEEAESFGRALEELVGADVERFDLVAEIYERHHPAEPVYYCQFLATVPAGQGRGIGSTLLRTMLERADREGMPAYHEATTPRNRALYERFGYVATGELTLPDGPPVWPMWRDPR